MFGSLFREPDPETLHTTISDDMYNHYLFTEALEALEGYPDLMKWAARYHRQTEVIKMWREAGCIRVFRLLCAKAALVSANKTSQDLGKELTAAYEKLTAASVAQDYSRVEAAHHQVTLVSAGVKSAIMDEAYADDLVEKMQKEVAEEKKRSADPSFSETMISSARTTLAGWVLAATAKK